MTKVLSARDRADIRQRSEKYKALLTECNISISGAARFLGIDQRTSGRWAQADMKVPDSALMLLALMAHYDCKPDKARKLAELDPLEAPVVAGVWWSRNEAVIGDLQKKKQRARQRKAARETSS